MKTKPLKLPPCLYTLMSLLLLPGWLHSASAADAGNSASQPALPEQDVWRRWEAAREARHPKPDNLAAYEAPAQANKASNVLGMAVRNTNNQLLGRIQDVVLDWQSGRVAYAVIQTAPQAETQHARLLAVPAAALKPSADHKHLVLDSGKSDPTTAYGFDPDNWPSVTSPGLAASPNRQEK
jgi:sporulation protein YlmC with PRC-barrel domain